MFAMHQSISRAWSAIARTVLLAPLLRCWQTLPDPRHVCPLYLYWDGLGDNFTSPQPPIVIGAGYRQVRVEAQILKDPWPGAVPLKLYYHLGRNDNFITATPQSEQAAIQAGYTLRRTEGYVFQHPIPGTIPLELYWHAGRGDYATVATAQGALEQINSGYSHVRTEGYVFAANNPNFGARSLDVEIYEHPTVPKYQRAYKTSFVVYPDTAASGCRYSWIGTVFEDNPHDVVLTICDTGVVGRAQVGDKVYEVNPSRMAKQAIFENRTPPTASTPAYGPIIDIATGYTSRVLATYTTELNLLPKAATPWPTMTPTAYVNANLQLAVDHLNAVLGASGIRTRMRLVKTRKFSNIFEESFSSVENALSRVAPRGAWFCDGGDDPYDVKSFRDGTGADLMSLWVDDSIRGTNAGAAYYSEHTYYCDQVNAYSVLRAGAALKNLTFAHEIGHNLGADHARGESNYNDPFQGEPYGFGYTDSVSAFYDIMSYGSACPAGVWCQRVSYFSTPLVKIDPVLKRWSLTGKPVGSASSADNARRIREESGPVSRYGSLKCPGNDPCTGTGGGGQPGGGGNENPPPVEN